MNTSNKKPSQHLRVRYEVTAVQYASQFVLNVTGEEIIVNFSSGSLPDPNSGETHLPIHTRIALTPEGTKRLVQLLNQALASQEAESAVPPSAAKLPSVQL